MLLNFLLGNLEIISQPLVLKARGNVRLVYVPPLAHELTVCLSPLQSRLLTETKEDRMYLSNNALYGYGRKNRLSAA